MTEQEQLALYRTTLQRMVDWTDCRCEHDDENCCGVLEDTDYHCPGCIAAQALAAGERS